MTDNDMSVALNGEGNGKKIATLLKSIAIELRPNRVVSLCGAAI